MSTVVNFGLIDYFFFSTVFIVSNLIGLFFAFRAKKQQHIDEYFFGGKNLGVVPVTLSLIATSISASTTIGMSMEVYAYGLHTVMYSVLLPIWGLIAYYIFLPIFYDLQLNSSFAYLELRFDRSVKHIASGIYVITGVFVIPMTIYAPALSFQEVTGVNIYVICLVSGFLCILYTTIGGFKAVVWTDVFQISLTVCSIVLILGVGLSSIGGYQNVWNAMERGGRLKFFNTDFNLKERGSIWAYLFSTSLLLLYNVSMTQSSIQRYLSLSSLKKAKTTLLLQTFIGSLIVLLTLSVGAVIYATYETCDPMSAGIVTKLDQVFAHYVQEKGSLFEGFNGIFIAGTFAAGLSTTSTFLNTISGTIYVDFLGNRLKDISQDSANRIMKLIVAVVGAIGICLIFLIEHLGNIFAITVQCYTISAIGIFGLFCSGMIFKNINSRGAKCGVITAMVVTVIIIAGSLKKKPDPVLPLRTDGCDVFNSSNFGDLMHVNITVENFPENHEELPWIFQINFQFFCLIGLIINLFVGSLISYITGGNEVYDQRLLLKFLRKDIPKETLLNKQ